MVSEITLQKNLLFQDVQCKLYDMKIIVDKWEDSFVLHIPKTIAEKAKLSAGKELLLTLTDDGQLIFKVKEEELTLADLVKGVTPENRHDLIK